MDPDPLSGLERFNVLHRNFKSFYPHLTRTFTDLVYYLGGPGQVVPDILDKLSQLVVGCPSILVDKTAVLLACQKEELPDFVRLVTVFHAAAPAAASAIIALYRQLAHPLAVLSAQLLDLAASGVFGSDKKARLLAWCFSSTLPDDRLAFLSGFAALARQSPAVIPRLLVVLDREFAKRSLSELRAWLGRGFSLVRAGRAEEASAYFCQQSSESRAFFGISGALLREEREILRIYCASLAGRECSILSVEQSAFNILGAYTDGKTLFLPAELNLTTDNQVNRRAYAALVALLSALPGSGTYAFDLDSCASRYDIGYRYGGLLPNLKTNLVMEYGQRLKTIRERRGNILELVFKTGRSLIVLETDLEKFFYLFPSPAFMRHLFYMLECCRVESQLAHRYDGLKQDFALLHRLAVNSLPNIKAPSANDLEEQRQYAFFMALKALYLTRLAASLDSDTVAVLGLSGNNRQQRLVEDLQKLFRRIYMPGATVQLSAEVAFEIYNVFFESFPLSAYAVLKHPIVSWRSLMDVDLEPAVVADQSPEFFPVKNQRFGHTGLGEEETQFVDLTRMSDTEKKQEQQRKDIKSRALRLYAYPEFDCQAQTYLPKHCALHEKVIEGGDESWYNALIHEQRQVLARIVKKFQSMQPEEVELTRRWYDGDEMHLGDAVDYAVDLQRGAAADERIYQRKVVNSRSVAVQILVDASSSTRDVIAGTTVIDLEKAALALLGSALHRLGDTFSIAAYNSNGPAAVSFFLAKDFYEGWSPKVRARLSAIAPWSANRDGCAIRHATMRLSALQEKTRILLLISDGSPADKDYGDSDGSQVVPYALEDTRRAILEAKRAGIIPFCLTIDLKAKEYIAHLYGDYNFSVLSDLSMLPQRLARLYVRLTR